MESDKPLMGIKGRGAEINPGNRFEKLKLEVLDEHLNYMEESGEKRILKTEFFNDHSKTILSKNDSPDLGFDYSINPYKGCEHGCIYCYARPTHEYLGFSSGVDFETKIMIKKNAPLLLEKEFQSKSWVPQLVIFSGNTDCYQPVERKLQLTRQCLEVFLKYKNPVGMITKNSLIKRDADILQEMAKSNLCSVTISITTLNKNIRSVMEPRTSTPQQRLDTVKYLSDKGIPVGVNIGPIIPGLTDEEIPDLVKAAADSGAYTTNTILLRLPWQVKELFSTWVESHFPARKEKILNRIKDVRGGSLYNSKFGERFKGEGKWPELITQIHDQARKKYGLGTKKIVLRTDLFDREFYQGKLF
ncbi:PA0069 family radical SAM protein [soil metagenome]